MSHVTPHALSERFARIIATLLAMVGARLERPGRPGLAGPLTLAIGTRLQRIRNRIARYVARFQAGTLTPPHLRTRPAVPRPPRTTPGQWDHLPKLPRGRMWLVRLVPGIGVGANYLKILLDEPEMRAMLAAPPQIGRTLRPLWHMLSPDPLPDMLRRPKAAPSQPPAESGRRPKAEPPCAPPPHATPEPPAPEVAGPACFPPPLPA